jgi:hypothetical protein
MAKIDVIPPPMSWQVKGACYLCGASSIVAGAISVVIFFTSMGPGAYFSFWPFLPIGFGVMVLQTPSKLETSRRERLARLEAGDATLALSDKPHISDSAMMAFIFGMTGLVAVALFSPLAVIFGVVALFRRSLGGLIGIVLGLAGIGLWLWMVGVLKGW